MTAADRVLLIYTTFETTDEARAAGGKLVDARLAACVNILPGMISIYEWEEQRQEAGEVVMIVKTRAKCLEEALELLKSVHPYETPALIVIEPVRTDPDFQKWICDQTAT